MLITTTLRSAALSICRISLHGSLSRMDRSRRSRGSRELRPFLKPSRAQVHSPRQGVPAAALGIVATKTKSPAKGATLVERSETRPNQHHHSQRTASYGLGFAASRTTDLRIHGTPGPVRGSVRLCTRPRWPLLQNGASGQSAENDPEQCTDPVGRPILGLEHSDRMIGHRRKVRHQKPPTEEEREHKDDDEGHDRFCHTSP